MRPFLRGIFGAAAAALLALFHLGEAASTNNAGGCSQTYNTQGYGLGVCISNMNGMALPDLYVDLSSLYIFGTINCQIEIETWDDQGNKYGSTLVNCTSGHQIALPIGPFPNDVIVHSLARISLGSGSYATGNSPPVAIQSTKSLYYNYKYVLASPPTPAASQVLHMTTNDFQASFPFHNCGNVIGVGTTCHLGNGSGFLPQDDNPIRFMAIGTTNFTYLTLPGHYEGAGRVFTFSFITNSTTQRLYFDVVSSGPWNATAEALRDSGSARSFWRGYADNLRAAIANGTVKI